MSKKEKTMITLTPEIKKKGKKNSVKLFGEENLSGYIQYLIQKYEK